MLNGKGNINYQSLLKIVILKGLGLQGKEKETTICLQLFSVKIWIEKHRACMESVSGLHTQRFASQIKKVRMI